MTTLSTEGTRDHGTKSFAGWPVTWSSDPLTSVKAVVRANFDSDALVPVVDAARSGDVVARRTREARQLTARRPGSERLV